MKIFIIFYLLASVASAQSTDQEIRQIEFTVYGQYPVRGVEYLPVDESVIEAGEKEAEPLAIETHTLARVGPYSFKGASVIRFRETESGKPAAEVTIPPQSNEWLLIFVRNPRHKEDPERNLKYLIYPFNDSLSNLPNNSLIFLNISGKELDGLVEDERVKLGKGESDSYRVQESLPINLWTRDFSGERLLPATIKTYKFRPNHRYLMIFFPPVLRGSADLDVRFIQELVNESE